MKNEYEAKFLNIDPNVVRNKLKNLGARLVKPKTLLIRVIFEGANATSEHAWVRLRDEGNRITLTYKQVTDSNTIHGTKEVELVVNDLDKTTEFLKAIGLKQVRYQQNYREEWQVGKAIFDLDTWPDLPTFLEIEASSEKEVKKYTLLLNLDYSQARFGSVDSIYLSELGRDILKEPKLIFDSL